MRLKKHIKKKKSVELFSADFNIYSKLLKNLMSLGIVLFAWLLFCAERDSPEDRFILWVAD